MGPAVTLRVHGLQHTQGERQHHGRCGCVADAHGQKCRGREQQAHRSAEVPARQGQQGDSHLAIELLHPQSRRQCKAPQKEKHDGIGKGCQRLLRGQALEAQQQGPQRHQQGHHRQRQGFGQPQHTDENSEAEALANLGLKGQPRIQQGRHGQRPQHDDR